LEEEQMKHKDELVKGEVAGTCQRLWTSALRLYHKGFYSVCYSIILMQACAKRHTNCEKFANLNETLKVIIE
jgi:hypothetical protein